MANFNTTKGTIGILTGGGDVPGLNPAIRGLTVRALREGYRVLGIRRGWAGLIEYSPDGHTNGDWVMDLTEEVVNKAGRTGGTFLHSSRTRPSHVPLANVPDRLRDRYNDQSNDLTEVVLANVGHLGIDVMIPIGGDDTLSYGVQLHKHGVPVIAIPKTMDNDVPGTDYCIGFSTCVTRTISMTHALRTSAGSHERFLVIEVFGRYAGFTALLPTMAGAANRCVIPEHPFDIEKLCELLSEDRRRNPSLYSVVLVSEGAAFKGSEEMTYEDHETDMFGHKKLGGIGDRVSRALRDLSPKYNNGRRVNTINQRLGYLVRAGDPDALDSIVPMAFGNLAMDLILEGVSGRLVCVRNGRYDHVPIDVVTSRKKIVDVGKFYSRDRLRPQYTRFGGLPTFIMTSDF
ncbi:MAG TPA: 6-phosphofructokinase [Thermoanaerobaculales bacterium]|nr:6-phosphofructokinase [Thermoanaerobaculales bacterium]HPA80453.1 6-phosphofructokinase [Thermoanaerobaculales bacterium]HQL30510.1 6-phosphofructokinase [Thermoanaerobaculales bacterium]HQN95197.1 6-phosphofructokinase [Thermoanaerobaculales bacterium]HQP44640.1 6-phosphofructokinase [Thermoanaerobaculales bacterium]